MEYRQGTAEISEAEIWEKEVPSPSSMEEVDGGWVRRFGPGGRQGTCPTLILPRGRHKLGGDFKKKNWRSEQKSGLLTNRFHCFGIFWGANLRSLREYHFEIWRMPGEVRCMTNWQPAHNFVPTGGGR